MENKEPLSNIGKKMDRNLVHFFIFRISYVSEFLTISDNVSENKRVFVIQLINQYDEYEYALAH